MRNPRILRRNQVKISNHRVTTGAIVRPQVLAQKSL
jgi:hypothetical protein